MRWAAPKSQFSNAVEIPSTSNAASADLVRIERTSNSKYSVMHLGKKRRSWRTWPPLIKLNSNPDWGHFHVNVIILVLLGDSTYHMVKTRKITDIWVWPKKKNHVRIVCEAKYSNSKAYEVYSHVLSHPSVIWKSVAITSRTSSMCRTTALRSAGPWY